MQKIGDIIIKDSYSTIPHFILPKREKVGRDFIKIDNILIYGGYAEVYGSPIVSIYNVLTIHADNYTQECFPSISRIKKLSGVKNRNKVIDTLKRLAAYHIIEIHTYGYGSGRNNLYRLVDKKYWLPIDSRDALENYDKLVNK